MNRRKLDKLKRELTQMRRSPQKARDLEGLARKLGRKQVKRGKEPTWESPFPELFPLSIPHHGGKGIATGTKSSILDQLEGDVLAWEECLDEENNQETGGDTDDTSGDDDDTG